MGRSVSTPSGTELVAYKGFDGTDDDYSNEFYWEGIVEDIVVEFTNKFPSLTACDKWLGREDHAILENQFVYIGISEYMGLVAIWAVPKEEHANLVGKFIDTLAPVFDKIGELRLVGRFSNGEAVFEKK